MREDGLAALLPTDDDVAFFQTRGYWIAPRFMDTDRIARCRDAMEDVYQGSFHTGRTPWAGWIQRDAAEQHDANIAPGYWQPGDDPGKIRKTDNAWWSDDTIAAVATDAFLGACAARLMGADTIRLWQDQLLHKPGGGFPEATAGWHQDLYYWGSAVSCDELLTAWVAFDDVTEDNGAVQVVAGSHQWGIVDDVSDFWSSDLDSQEEAMAQAGRDVEIVPLVMDAGQASFHHCLTLHGSRPNLTDSPRRGLAVHLQTDAVRSVPSSDSRQHYNVALLEDLGGSAGDPFVGKYWPQVHPQL